MKRLVLSMAVACFVLPTGAVAAAPKTRFVVTGPTTELKLNTPYTYTFKVVSPTSSRWGYLSWKLPGCTGVVQHVRLMAGRPLVRKFVVTYELNIAPLTLEAAVSVTGRHPKALAVRKLPITLEAGQPDTTGVHPKCNPLFGS